MLGAPGRGPLVSRVGQSRLVLPVDLRGFDDRHDVIGLDPVAFVDADLAQVAAYFGVQGRGGVGTDFGLQGQGLLGRRGAGRFTCTWGPARRAASRFCGFLPGMGAVVTIDGLAPRR